MIIRGWVFGHLDHLLENSIVDFYAHGDEKMQLWDISSALKGSEALDFVEHTYLFFEGLYPVRGIKVVKET